MHANDRVLRILGLAHFLCLLFL